jgi:hypothetical protein
MNTAPLVLVVGLMGSLGAITGTFLPWIQANDPADGVTLTKAGIEGHYAMLVVALAVLTGATSCLLLRRRTTVIALTLISLGAAQVALETFVGINLARGVVQLEAAGAAGWLGTGLYVSGLGSAGVVVAGILAWRTQESPSRAATSSDSSVSGES